ncbi:hypothetical protein BaRGS_00029117, partial [Batillaria attramentaria]
LFAGADEAFGDHVIFTKNQAAKYHQCYEDKCRCTKTKADCSKNYGRLNFIPELPREIRCLNFSFNNLSEIRDSGFFDNVTRLTGLDLSDNGLVYICPDCFSRLQKLEYLQLSYNYNLNNSALSAALSVSTLRRLDIIHGSLGPLPDDIFYKYPLPHLETLYLHQNHLHHVNLSAFVPLPRLRQLGLKGNDISDVQSDRLSLLETLTLGSNYIKSFLNTCSSGRSLFPRLRKLFLNGNSIPSISADVCLPSLSLLNLDGNLLWNLERDTLNIHMFPSLLELFLGRMTKPIKTVKKCAFESSVLQRISLVDNYLNFGGEDVDPECFAGCPNLTNLQLSNNKFSTVSDRKWELMFGNFSNLRYLHLDEARIVYLPAAIVSLPSLQNLTLAYNFLSDLPDGLFDKLGRLKRLVINDNHISTLCKSRGADEAFGDHVIFTKNQAAKYHQCYEDKCRCTKTEADCSKNYGRLNFIPKLPREIRCLNFSFNNLSEIRDSGFFDNVTRLTGLDLSDNGLIYICPDCFSRLQKLENLQLSYNNMNNSVLPAALSVSTLRRLDIIHGSLGPLPDDIFYKYPLPHLQTSLPPSESLASREPVGVRAPTPTTSSLD